MTLARLFIAAVAFSGAATYTKDGHATGADSSVQTVPAAQPARTYYSYSYKASGTAAKPAPVRVSDYAHKGATLVDSYKGLVPSGTSTRNWSATGRLNAAQGKLATKINELKK